MRITIEAPDDVQIHITVTDKPADPPRVDQLDPQRRAKAVLTYVQNAGNLASTPPAESSVG